MLRYCRVAFRLVTGSLYPLIRSPCGASNYLIPDPDSFYWSGTRTEGEVAPFFRGLRVLSGLRCFGNRTFPQRPVPHPFVGQAPFSAVLTGRDSANSPCNSQQT